MNSAPGLLGATPCCRCGYVPSGREDNWTVEFWTHLAHNGCQALRIQRSQTNCHCHPGDRPPQGFPQDPGSLKVIDPPRHRDPEWTWCESLLMPSPDPVSLLLILSQAPGDAKPPVCPEVAQSRTCKIKRPFRNLLQNRLSTVTLYYLSAEMGISESLQ